MSPLLFHLSSVESTVKLLLLKSTAFIALSCSTSEVFANKAFVAGFIGLLVLSTIAQFSARLAFLTSKSAGLNPNVTALFALPVPL